MATPQGPRRGRPSKLTPEAHAAVVQALVNGLSRRHAATCAGVAHRTFNLWRSLGRRGQGGPAYRDFFLDTEAAAVKPVVANMVRLQNAARGGDVLQRTTVTRPDGTVVVTERKAAPNVGAIIWWLERLHGDQYGAQRDELKALRKEVAELVALVAALSPAAPAAPA